MYTNVVMKHRKTVLRTFLLCFILVFFWRGTPTREQCGCPPVLLDSWRLLVLICAYVMSVFVQYVLVVFFCFFFSGREPSVIGWQEQSSPQQFKAPVRKAFFYISCQFCFANRGGHSFRCSARRAEWGSFMRPCEAFNVRSSQKTHRAWSNLATHYISTKIELWVCKY